MTNINISLRLRKNVSDLAYSANCQNYNGDLTVGSRTFRYALRFAVPINRLDELARENSEYALQQIHLDIFDEMSHPVDDRTRDYFMGIIPALAIEFYYRDSIIPACLERSRLGGHSEIEMECSLPQTAELENILVRR